MIDTTYIRIATAAEMLSTDIETILIAATEDRIRLYWLFNRIVAAERGSYEEWPSRLPDEPPIEWVPDDFSVRRFMYIPMQSNEAAELLKSDSIKADGWCLSDQDKPGGSFWIASGGLASSIVDISENDLCITTKLVFVKRADVICIRDGGAGPPGGAIPQLPSGPNRAHVSDKLAKMNQAAAKFWGNADRNDRGTHPDNATVTAWLVKQGFSQTLADKAATIIRPEWAPSGRRPEE